VQDGFEDESMGYGDSGEAYGPSVEEEETKRSLLAWRVRDGNLRNHEVLARSRVRRQ
jgi:hypothetical protein